MESACGDYLVENLDGEPDEIVLSCGRLKMWFACRTSSDLPQPALLCLLLGAEIEAYSPTRLDLSGAAAAIRPLLPGYILVHVERPVFDIAGRRITYVGINGEPLIVADADTRCWNERARDDDVHDWHTSLPDCSSGAVAVPFVTLPLTGSECQSQHIRCLSIWRWNISGIFGARSAEINLASKLEYVRAKLFGRGHERYGPTGIRNTAFKELSDGSFAALAETGIPRFRQLSRRPMLRHSIARRRTTDLNQSPLRMNAVS